ncbi:MAG: aminotransferase class V-fold PLP-dependent enzyme [Phycisphaerales bacterium]|nr:aminotransferase class V-fold PLP-dependent enzyme [Phycisphaerales bacterium]
MSAGEGRGRPVRPRPERGGPRAAAGEAVRVDPLGRCAGHRRADRAAQGRGVRQAAGRGFRGGRCRRAPRVHARGARRDPIRHRGGRGARRGPHARRRRSDPVSHSSDQAGPGGVERFETRLVRFEACPGDPHRATATPIYQTATFEQESALEFGEYDYTRSGNPTRAVLERQLAALDGGGRALAFASGLAALTAATRLLEPGDELVAGDDLYGGAYRLFARVASERGVRVRYADLADPEAAERAIGPRTRLVHVESPTNPLLRIVDLRRLASVCRRQGARLLVDSTAMSPYLQRPLELGADIVLHSATKLLNGHGDVTAGALVVRDGELGERLAWTQNAEGAGLAPLESFLLLRGLKTLAVRVDRQQRTALEVARFLEGHPLVGQVRFPGLAGHTGRAVHERQASGPGVVLSFQTGDVPTSARLVEGLRRFSIAVSFGSVQSTASLPCRMSHASIPSEVRAARRLPEDLVRLSIGLEAAEDLIADLERAIGEAAAGRRPEPAAAEASGAAF